MYMLKKLAPTDRIGLLAVYLLQGRSLGYAILVNFPWQVGIWRHLMHVGEPVSLT